MKTVALLIIVVSHQGYWFGGQEQTISIQPTIETGFPQAKIAWELMLGNAKLAQNETILKNQGQTQIKLAVPAARAQCDLNWHYRVIALDDDKELDSGNISIHLFPSIDFSASTSLKGKRIVLIDPSHALAGRKSDIRQINDPAQLVGLQADIVLVAPDALDASQFAQGVLWEQVAAGAQALILEQTRVRNLGDYSIVTRAPAGICWQNRHLLFTDLHDEDLNHWIDGMVLQPIRLPPDAPLLKLAFWPRESKGKAAVAMDALVAVESIGKGRIVFCQLPMVDWLHDPRSQIIVCNALNYLQTPVEPTSTSSQCCATQPLKVRADREISFPTGDER